MSSSSSPSIPTLRLLRLLLWVEWRSMLARLRSVRRESPLLLFVLSGFVIGYLVIGYTLFHAGLDYLYHFPIVGSLLSQRILFLIFGFFFVMLVFSNLIIGYSTLFKSRETQWLLTLPVRHLNVYRWKFIEALAVSSWALIFLSAPMMAAFGAVHSVAPIFYFRVALVYGPFVVLPALCGSWIILLLVRVLAKPLAKRIVILLAASCLVLLLFGLKPITEFEAVAQQDVLSFDQLLRRTRLSLNPFLPSAWIAKSVLAWSDELGTQGTFYFLLLLANALMGLLVGFELLGRLYYGSWSVALSSRAERFQRAAVAKRKRHRRRGIFERLLGALPLGRAEAALIVKDVRLFWRDPAQWIQFMIFFGLLCIYVLNLRNVAFNFQNQFWETMISYLNLAASALTLSTLTTRFVFPQFSLEGRRLWILGLAPVGLCRVIHQKFWLSCVTASIITVSLMAASSLSLNLPILRRLPLPSVLFFVVTIAIMSASLSGLAVGLGALFPNFKEDNPSKIVSGFGGTLCLVISFIYISVTVALVAVPGLRIVTKIQFPIGDGIALTLALGLSLALLLIPMAMAHRQVKNLEI